MTAREHARPAGDRAAEGARAAVNAEPAPALPERLLAARERKGVDLYRAERDTKIRARYLGALERGAYKELPGAVYTKGFLRNYALYLGLDPDDILAQWHRERGPEAIGSEPVIVVPRAIQAPRQGLAFSPAVFVAAILTVGVLLFAGYLGVQVLRLVKPPTIAVTDPVQAVTQVDDSTTQYDLRGTSIPGATISISTSGPDKILLTAGPDGTWNQTVSLRRGRNEFMISATDPETGKQAENPVRILITVPFSVVQAPTLTLDSPADGSTIQNGAVPISGSTTNATKVAVTAAYLGPVGAPTGGKPAASPSPQPTPQPASVDVASDGGFNTGYELSAGRWSLTVTASSAEGKTIALTRTVTIGYQGVNLIVSVKSGRAWLTVWVDGTLVQAASNRTYSDGKVLTFNGQQSVMVWTGSSGTTYFTVNGKSLGHLGPSGVSETWLFSPSGPPKQTQHP